MLPGGDVGREDRRFTNADRTVHLSERAVDPPGEARADLDIFLDYARRMDFRDRDGAPLIKWHDAEGAFEAWKACSQGRPCDYSGLSYERLRGAAGIQWPCTDDAPDGTERLYADGVFNTDPDDAETYGQDLVTGAPASEDEYRAKQPRGRAFLHAADYHPSPETPSDEFPLLLTTGRTVVPLPHPHQDRPRAPSCRPPRPTSGSSSAARTPRPLGIAEGDRVRVRSPRGAIEAPARIAGIRPGVVFVPFHYGYWDDDDDGRAGPPTS